MDLTSFTSVYLRKMILRLSFASFFLSIIGFLFYLKQLYLKMQDKLQTKFMIISICLSLIYIYIHEFTDFLEGIIACHVLKYVFFPRKLDSCASFLPWSLTPRKGTCIFKVISRERDSFEINSSYNKFWWIERKCIKNLVKKTQVGSFQKFSRSNASCTMYIVFNARHWDCFDNFFLQIFKDVC